MKTRTTIKFKLVEDGGCDYLYPWHKGQELHTDSPPWTEAQWKLWEDYTDEGVKAYKLDRDNEDLRSPDALFKRLKIVAEGRTRTGDNVRDKAYRIWAGSHVFAIERTVKTPDPLDQTIMEALRQHGTGKCVGNNSRAHCVLTWKDADLDPHGEQYITVLGTDGKSIPCEANIGKTFVGTDVSFEVPDDKYEKAIELWLEQATEIVCGCGVSGEWDGDSWFMYERRPFRVKIRSAPELTANAIVDKAKKVLKPAERELILADEMMDTLYKEIEKQFANKQPRKQNEWTQRR